MLSRWMFWIHPNIPPPCNAFVLQRILSFRDVPAKMSKTTVDPKSSMLPTDPYETVVKRIRSAVTDSISGITFDSVERLGMSTLLIIFSACTDEEPAVLAEQYAGSNYCALKNDLAEVEGALRKHRTEFVRLRGEKMFLGWVARDGAEKA